MQGVFYLPHPLTLCSKEMKKPDMLFHEILQLRDDLVGSLAYFHFGTEQEMWGVVSYKKNCKFF